MPLELRRPRDFRAATSNPDDDDVLDGERRVGRIFRPSLFDSRSCQRRKDRGGAHKELEPMRLEMEQCARGIRFP
jgi:hypothetical protein